MNPIHRRTKNVTAEAQRTLRIAFYSVFCFSSEFSAAQRLIVSGSLKGFEALALDNDISGLCMRYGFGSDLALVSAQDFNHGS